MKKTIEDFLNLIEKDAEFSKKVLQQKKKENVIKTASVKGIELTEEDIDTINKELKNRSKKNILERVDEDTPAGQLLKKMFADDSFAEEILSQSEEEKVIEIAAEHGLNLGSQDIKEVNEILQESAGISSGNFDDGELTEEELENVAGGATPGAVAITVSVTVTYSVQIGLAAVAATVTAATIAYSLYESNS